MWRLYICIHLQYHHYTKELTILSPEIPFCSFVIFLNEHNIRSTPLTYYKMHNTMLLTKSIYMYIYIYIALFILNKKLYTHWKIIFNFPYPFSSWQLPFILLSSFMTLAILKPCISGIMLYLSFSNQIISGIIMSICLYTLSQGQDLLLCNAQIILHLSKT